MFVVSNADPVSEKTIGLGTIFSVLAAMIDIVNTKKERVVQLVPRLSFLFVVLLRVEIDETMSPVANEANDMGNPDTFSQKVFSSILFWSVDETTLA